MLSGIGINDQALINSASFPNVANETIYIFEAPGTKIA